MQLTIDSKTCAASNVNDICEWGTVTRRCCKSGDHCCFSTWPQPTLPSYKTCNSRFGCSVQRGLAFPRQGRQIRFSENP
ncbi:hypothetical protein V1264_016996 [Littorina saxatilis]|uniref:Uncharacterized protein n=1 Tax=Littorina saxatilis TaxID=31220 RepID=A0AAN9BGA9_9CAEN